MGKYYNVVTAYKCTNCGTIHDTMSEARHCCD